MAEIADTDVFGVEDVWRMFRLPSRRALERLISVGEFPEPRRMGRKVYWTGEDLKAWMKISGRLKKSELPRKRRKNEGGEDRGEGE